jgi:hypothetical protein
VLVREVMWCECVLIPSASWFLVAQYQQWVSSLIPSASNFFFTGVWSGLANLTTVYGVNDMYHN